MIWCLWKQWPHGAAVSDLPRQKSDFPQNKEVQFSILFLLYPLHKIFSHLQNKKVRNNVFLYIKIDFWHSRYGPVVAFIPDNISVHVHLLEDNDAIKNQRWLLSAGWFSTKTTRVFQRRSLLVYLCRFCRQRKVKTFSSCGAHFRRGYNIFSVQIATPTVCITRQMHKQISWPITWLQVFERGLESEPVGGEILFGLRGGGGGLTNSKWLLACMGYHPAPQEGT